MAKKKTPKKGAPISAQLPPGLIGDGFPGMGVAQPAHLGSQSPFPGMGTPGGMDISSPQDQGY